VLIKESWECEMYVGNEAVWMG